MKIWKVLSVVLILFLSFSFFPNNAWAKSAMNLTAGYDNQGYYEEIARGFVSCEEGKLDNLGDIVGRGMNLKEARYEVRLVTNGTQGIRRFEYTINRYLMDGRPFDLNLGGPISTLVWDIDRFKPESMSYARPGEPTRGGSTWWDTWFTKNVREVTDRVIKPRAFLFGKHAGHVPIYASFDGRPLYATEYTFVCRP